MFAVVGLFASMLSLSSAVLAADSVCYGSTSKGRLEGGVQLPEAGPNFSAYSSLGVSLGRTYVHSKVAATIAEAYRRLNASTPDRRYVYGESGWQGGGRIKPHRTHQNGLAVDFMTPVRDAQGHSVPLPTGLTNKLGYGIEFDGQGRYGSLRIDLEAIADHLLALDVSARKNGIGISRVIFDRASLQALYKTANGALVQERINFMKGEPWVRHDEHYHVDFAVACRPL